MTAWPTLPRLSVSVTLKVSMPSFSAARLMLPPTTAEVELIVPLPVIGVPPLLLLIW